MPRSARNKQNKQKTRPETIEAREKAAKALELRKEGRTFADIATEIGYNSPQAAFDAVKRAMDRICREPAEELIRLESERLDALFGIQYLNAQSGDVAALDACMKIMTRRAKLLGLDAPARTDNKTEVTTPGVLVVPGVVTEEQWAGMAAAQQAGFQRDDSATG